jgi:hypothetical protein
MPRCELTVNLLTYSYMASLPITISKKTARRYYIEIDSSRLKRLADVFGFYNPVFVEEIDQAERDIRAGRVRKIRSFKDLER